MTQEIEGGRERNIVDRGQHIEASALEEHELVVERGIFGYPELMRARYGVLCSGIREVCEGYLDTRLAETESSAEVVALRQEIDALLAAFDIQASVTIADEIARIYGELVQVLDHGLFKLVDALERKMEERGYDDVAVFSLGQEALWRAEYNMDEKGSADGKQVFASTLVRLDGTTFPEEPLRNEGISCQEGVVIAQARTEEVGRLPGGASWIDKGVRLYTRDGERIAPDLPIVAAAPSKEGRIRVTLEWRPRAKQSASEAVVVTREAFLDREGNLLNPVDWEADAPLEPEGVEAAVTFFEAEDFQYGIAAVRLTENGPWFTIDINGNAFPTEAAATPADARKLALRWQRQQIDGEGLVAA